METSKILVGYLIYLPITIGLTLFVSKILFKNGRLFMIEIFHGKQDIALATNQLFKMGFYLLNIGFALLIMEISSNGFNNSYQNLVEILSHKIGGFTIYLGIMLFFNLFMFFKGRKKSKQTKVMEHLIG